MAVSRQVKEGRLTQGRNERLAYLVDTTPWGGYSSGASVKLFDVTNTGQRDEVAANLSGSPSVVSNVITTPAVISLIPGNLYRLEVQWVYSGNTLEAWVEIRGEY